MKKEYKCNLCNKTYKGQGWLDKHIERRHKTKPYVKPDPYIDNYFEIMGEKDQIEYLKKKIRVLESFLQSANRRNGEIQGFNDKWYKSYWEIKHENKELIERIEKLERLNKELKEMNKKGTAEWRKELYNIEIIQPIKKDILEMIKEIKS